MPNDTYLKPSNGWVCFHCGEHCRTPGEAEDHFGRTPDCEPACLMKIRIGGERGLIRALRKAQRRADRLARQVETLEYQTRLSATDWQRITGLREAYDAKLEIDSLEGRAITAEAILDDIAERWPALVEASTRRVTDGPTVRKPQRGCNDE